MTRIRKFIGPLLLAVSLTLAVVGATAYSVAAQSDPGSSAAAVVDQAAPDAAVATDGQTQAADPAAEQPAKPGPTPTPNPYQGLPTGC